MGGVLVLGAALAACASLEGLTTSSAGDAGNTPVDAASEGASDAGVADADAARPTTCAWNAPFATPRVVVTSDGGDGGDDGVAQAQLSPDELVIYFQVRNGANHELYRAARTSKELPFGARVPMTELNEPAANDTNIAVSSDGLLAVFTSDRLDAGVPDFFVARRTSLVASFDTPSPITTLGPTPEKSCAFITKDGNELWFSVVDGPERKTYLSPITGAGFGKATLRPDVNGWFPILSDDKLTIYYALGLSSLDNAVRVAHRDGPLEPFRPASLVNEVNAAGESPSWLSPDQCRLYITTRRNIDKRPEIFVAERMP